MPDVVGRQDPTVLFEMLDALSEENNNSGGNTTQNNRTVADSPYLRAVFRLIRRCLMADIGEITVRITGDASDLAATLGSAKNQLADFANIQANSGTAGTRTGSLGSRLRRSPKLHHREAHLHSKPYGLPEQHSTLLCSPKRRN